jgi:hypothetical protein
MGNIPQNLIDRMMIKCARRCCICRRLRPTKLQVHHINLESDGGTDDEENLIVTCTSCHTDVHSIVPFTRRFSVNELKGHRDALVQMLSEGKLPKDEPDNTDQILDRVIYNRSRLPETRSLSPEAIEILLDAANATENRQGIILIRGNDIRLDIFPGNKKCPYEIGDRRSQAKYKAALRDLENKGLIERESDAIYEVTHLGYLLSDEIASLHGQPDPPSP